MYDESMNMELMQASRKELLKNGIKGIHEAFADYMLINPACRLREMSAHFGYTVAWICTVINSDMFQAYFSKRRGDINSSIAADLPTKLAAAAHLATERVMEVIEKSDDADTLIDAFDKILHRHGYAPVSGNNPGASIIAKNVFYITKDELAASRTKLLESHAPAPQEEKVVNGTVLAASA